MKHVALLTLAALLAPASRARAQDDYDPTSSAWNGLSGFVAAARGAGIELEVVDQLDAEELSPSDALILVYPTEDLPVASLAAFMRGGGRIALLDDFGEGAALLEVYRIERTAGAPADVASLRGNPDLPLATPASAHALTEGVRALVANHPATLHHDELDPLFAFRERESLVLAGAVGEGRLVAVSDPSVLINNMLELEDNRRFAENLVRYVEAGASGRVYLLLPGAEITGRPGDADGGPFAGLTSWLDRIAHSDAPPTAVWAFAVVIAAIFVVIAVGSLPRKSPYDSSAMFAREPSSGGFVGRVGFFSRHRADLYQPTLAYKFELEGDLVRRLGLGSRAILRDVIDALRARGLGEAEIAEARALLLELDHLRHRQDLPEAPPRVPPARFRAIVAAGERLRSRSGERA